PAGEVPRQDVHLAVVAARARGETDVGAGPARVLGQVDVVVPLVGRVGGVGLVDDGLGQALLTGAQAVVAEDDLEDVRHVGLAGQEMHVGIGQVLVDVARLKVDVARLVAVDVHPGRVGDGGLARPGLEGVELDGRALGDRGDLAVKDAGVGVVRGGGVIDAVTEPAAGR